MGTLPGGLQAEVALLDCLGRVSLLLPRTCFLSLPLVSFPPPSWGCLLTFPAFPGWLVCLPLLPY